MSEVSLIINGRSYNVACTDGQEDHLRKLGEHLDERVCQLAGSLGTIGEARLLVVASLLLSDELFEAYKQIHELKGGAGVQDDSAADALEACAERVETIAARLAGA